MAEHHPPAPQDPRASQVLQIDATTTTGDFSVEARFETTRGITALFGPSGAGKSVTLATVAGLLRPSRGTVVLDGQTVADARGRVHVPTQQRHVGMVFQHAALLPYRSPLGNVALAVRGPGNRRERSVSARRWLERVRASHLAEAPTARLSGGEQQLVALARALAGEPRLLLLDEPFSALDQPTRGSLRDLLRGIVSEEGIAALLVTHDRDDITAVADRIVHYEPGRTVGMEDVSK